MRGIEIKSKDIQELMELSEGFRRKYNPPTKMQAMVDRVRDEGHIMLANPKTIEGIQRLTQASGVTFPCQIRPCESMPHGQIVTVDGMYL